MPSPSRRPCCRPQVVLLEERLPLGDGVLGTVLGLSLLGHASPAAATHDAIRRCGETGTSAPGSVALPGITLPARQGENALVGVAPEIDAVAPDWGPLAHAFAPPVRRHLGMVSTSPRPEQGSGQPLFAPRAGELGTARHAIVPAPVLAVPGRSSDEALLATLAGIQPSEPPTATDVTPAQKGQVKENFGQLPLYFEENVGQTDAQVHFFTRGPGYGLFLTSTEAVMVLSEPTPPESDVLASGGACPRRACDPLAEHTAGTSPAARQQGAVVRMQLVGANATPAVTGHDEQPGKINYFLGNDPAKWRTNVATFGRVEYDQVYPGIDLVWYGSQRQLEYDFVVAPGADPTQIRLRFAHADRIELDAAGDLLVHVGEPGGAGASAGRAGSVSDRSTLRQHKPFVYQTVGSTRQEVASRFVLEGQQVRFAVAAYDPARPLVIDPVLSYSTYLGGSGEDVGTALAVDPATGDVLLTGSTLSTDFPTADPLQASNGGVRDVFVARLNAAGSALVYSTYLGGSGGDRGFGLAVDPATGDVLLAGDTLSTDFPTANPLQASNRGDRDAFVARLNAAGSALVYSTYLGGSNHDEGRALAVDPATGDALLTGETYSTNFPTANPFQPRLRGGIDAFVTRIGSSPVAYYYVYPDSGQVTAGVPLDLYVFALDAQFNVIPDYTGLVLFYATDPQAQTPGYHQYQRMDRGIASFPGGLTFHTPGLQELYVFDWPGVQVFGYAAFDVRP